MWHVRAADDESGQVGGEQPGTAERGAARVAGERDARCQHRRQPGRGQRQPAQQDDGGGSGEQAGSRPDQRLFAEQHDRVAHAGVADAHLHEEDHEQRRDRVVEPALELEQRGDALPQVDAARRREHGRRVGRRHDGTDQQRVGRRQIEHQVGGPGHDDGRHEDPHRREQRRGHPDELERPSLGQRTALEQDQRERGGADVAHEGGVVERDPARTVHPEEDAETEEEQQCRGADAVGERGGDGADNEHRDEDREFDRYVHAASLSPLG